MSFGFAPLCSASPVYWQGYPQLELLSRHFQRLELLYSVLSSLLQPQVLGDEQEFDAARFGERLFWRTVSSIQSSSWRDGLLINQLVF